MGSLFTLGPKATLIFRLSSNQWNDVEKAEKGCINYNFL